MKKRDVWRKLQNLIEQSCDFKSKPSEAWQQFHKDFLKISLEALDITLNYDKNTISSRSAKPVQIDASTIQKLRDSVNPIIAYNDLEATLKGCVKKELFFQHQYERLIDSYPNDLLESVAS